MVNSPPLEHEVEITLFGTGYGECVLLHLLDNKWIIVDSCVNPLTRNVAPLEYLDSINVDSSKQVELLVVSHWHDDHIKGLSKIQEVCINAQLVLSQAMHQKEFFRFVNVIQQKKIYNYAGRNTDEIMRILENMLKRGERSGDFKCKWASMNTKLYSKKFKRNEVIEKKVTALSPLDNSITNALIEISKLIPEANTETRVNSNINPNFFAIALWISLGDIQILLGSDLEESAHPKGAWSIIANDDNNWQKAKADVFKIPHHGSQNAYCPLVYEKMLTNRHIAILTPFSKGKVNLPNDADIIRLKEQKCSHIYMACKNSGKIKKHDPVDKILNESTISRKTLNSFGSITLRKNVLDKSSDWQITKRHHAHEL
ncbi:ribonuclease domain-containing protein [Desulfonema limicola]|uniref:Ribonuclease domain-containing protein n=1 Tax=Desulfonema limicola TaxID=45656 RepID=A0A975GIP5_9BACT|nr:hypothetical protein [Desulfonema limicola]QTA82782.1 ribonuclease domain-containing protein [Desulfonema limicola]